MKRICFFATICLIMSARPGTATPVQWMFTSTHVNIWGIYGALPSPEFDSYLGIAPGSNGSDLHVSFTFTLDTDYPASGLLFGCPSAMTYGGGGPLHLGDRTYNTGVALSTHYDWAVPGYCDTDPTHNVMSAVTGVHDPLMPDYGGFRFITYFAHIAINPDGTIDEFALASGSMQLQFGFPAAAGPVRITADMYPTSFFPVPEPGSWSLLVLGLAITTFVRRRFACVAN